MPKEDYKEYFQTLELNSTATIPEIKNAYLRLKKMYSSESSLITPITIEFSKRKRHEIIKKIEKAYLKIMALRQKEREESLQRNAVEPERDIPRFKAKYDPFFSGLVLKKIRTKLGMQLYEVALDTKIRINILENIELEKYDSLPSESYLKEHLRIYSKYLSLSPKKVVEDYINKYNAWKTKPEEKG